MILDSSEEVLPEACWNGRKEAVSSVIGVHPTGANGSYFLSEREWIR